MRPWALITPASRGIGLALTRRVLQTTRCSVVATARTELDKAREDILRDLEGVDENEASMEEAASHCRSEFPTSSHHLRLALTVPGILHPEKSPAKIDADDALQTFRVNTLGPLLLMKHFSPFLPSKRGKDFPTASSASASARNSSSNSKDEEGDRDDGSGELDGLNPSHVVWAVMSARVGSISDNALGGWYSYRASKAAVNQLVKTFDNHLKTASGERAMAVGLHPGTVRTGLSKEFWGNVKEGKLFEGEWVAGRLLSLLTGRHLEAGVKEIGLEARGRCWDWKGEEVPP
ncbi:hypothetical protein LTS18_002657 [Coniosporium uncinatum]|uniref:Uncharacterized protein n=1 Tax=Coniosporium uncinatum TaxID=93489 RepID=A0ACC3DUN6_9PEZI|nr:hypothetical protein LTS18_002657 [Coniosporium uncinatum]